MLCCVVLCCVVLCCVGQSDAYLSVVKSLTHSGVHLNADIRIIWIEATDLEQHTLTNDSSRYERAWNVLRNEVCGILVPGGFGVRGIEGKVAAAKFARESGIPYLGLCLGMQVMVIEYCRNILMQTDANSVEFDENTNFPAVVFMPEGSQVEKGGTMRLGARDTQIRKYVSDVDDSTSHREISNAWELYGLEANSNVIGTGGDAGGDAGMDSNCYGIVSERHRHRYEVNPSYFPMIEEHGLYFTGRGVGEHAHRMEIAELPRSQHKFYVGAQFHPELKSRPHCPSPLVFGFVASCLRHVGSIGTEQHASSFAVAGQLWQSTQSVRSITTAATAGAATAATAAVTSTTSSSLCDVHDFQVDNNEDRIPKRAKLDDRSTALPLPVTIVSDIKVDELGHVQSHPRSQPSSEGVAGACSPIKPWDRKDTNK